MTAPPSPRRYLWCGERICQARDATDTVTRRYYDESELAVAATGDVATFYAEDHLGSIRDLRMGDGQVLASYDYDPYGRDPIGEAGGINLYGYVGGNPVSYMDPTGEDGGLTVFLAAWAIAYVSHAGDAVSQENGNVWGQARGQDKRCTLGPVLGAVGDHCFPERCIRHDQCYEDNRCNASSWISSAVGGTKSCNQCNGDFF